MPRLSPLFEALASPRRRRIMFALLDCGPDETISIEPEADLFDCSDPRTLRVELRHVHLPHLAQHDFVDWRRDSEEIAPGPAFGPIREPLAVLRQYAEAREPA